MGFCADLFGLAAQFFRKAHFGPKAVAFGVFLQHGDQDAAGPLGFGGRAYVIQHLLPQSFAAMGGVDQQKPEIGIIGVREAKDDPGYGNKLFVWGEEAKVQGFGGVCAGWRACEEIGYFGIAGRLAGCEQCIVSSTDEQIPHDVEISIGNKCSDHRTITSSGS